MAHLLFGADLSLALPNRGQHGDRVANSGIPITGIDQTAADTCAWPHCTQPIGNKDHPPGLVDFLGALPVLETVGIPVSPAGSHKSCDPVNNPESISTQLTLFYAGTVNVFDNVTADKAQIVLSFAENRNSTYAAASSFKMPMASSVQPSARSGLPLQDPMKRTGAEMQENITATAHLSVGERLEVSDDRHEQELASLLVPCQAIVPRALPIARKASLARFLEKRKERARLMAPYLAKGNALDVIHQGAQHSSAGNLHNIVYNERWSDPSAKKLRCASGFGYSDAVDVEDRNWFISVENSKQASECGSAT